MAKVIPETGKLAPTPNQIPEVRYPIYPHKIDQSGVILAEGLENVAKGIFATLDNAKLEEFKSEYYGEADMEALQDRMDSLSQERQGIEMQFDPAVRAGTQHLTALETRLREIDNSMRMGYQKLEDADIRKKAILRNAIASAPWLAPDFKALAAGDPTIGAAVGNSTRLSGGKVGAKEQSLMEKLQESNIKDLMKAEGRTLTEKSNSLNLALEVAQAKQEAMLSQHSVERKLRASFLEQTAGFTEQLDQFISAAGAEGIEGKLNEAFIAFEQVIDTSYSKMKDEATKGGIVRKDFDIMDQQFKTLKEDTLSNLKTLYDPKNNFSVKQKQEAFKILTDHPSIEDVIKYDRFLAGYMYHASQKDDKVNPADAMSQGIAFIGAHKDAIDNIRNNPEIRDKIVQAAMLEGEEGAAARAFLPILNATEEITQHYLNAYGSGADFATSNRFLQQLQTQVLGEAWKSPDTPVMTRETILARASEAMEEGYDYVVKSIAQGKGVPAEYGTTEGVKRFRNASKKIIDSMAMELKDSYETFKGGVMSGSVYQLSDIQFDQTNAKFVALDREGKPLEGAFLHPKLKRALEKASNYIRAQDKTNSWEVDTNEQMSREEVRQGEINRIIGRAKGELETASQEEAMIQEKMSQEPQAEEAVQQQTPETQGVDTTGTDVEGGGIAYEAGGIEGEPQQMPKDISDPDLSPLSRVVAKAESYGGDYNILNGERTPSRNLTEMTIDEVASLGKAAGKFQIVPNTMKDIKRTMGLRGDEKFTPELQEAMFIDRLRVRGLDSYMAGKMDEDTFINRVAQEWAGLPNTSGKSAYQGYNGNKATVSLDEVRQAVKALKESEPVGDTMEVSEVEVQDNAPARPVKEGALRMPTEFKSIPKATSGSVVYYVDDFRGRIRNKRVVPELEEKLAIAAQEALPQGYRIEIYSGRQDVKGKGNRRTGSTRHDHAAADVKIIRPDGTVERSDEIQGRMIQWWLAEGGNVGTFMAGGGIHFDLMEGRARQWHYGNVSPYIKDIYRRGIAGEYPEGLNTTDEMLATTPEASPETAQAMPQKLEPGTYIINGELVEVA